MRPNESLGAQPVRSLQTMLRVIAEDDGSSPTVVPDGIYGPQTIRAVSAFQQNHGIPITGVTDEDTWNAVAAVYEPALIRIGPAQPLELILEPNQVIRKGEENPNLYVIQAVLLVLSEAYGTPPPNQSGILDEATATSIMHFQQMHALEPTGELDKLTWKAIALQYPLAANQLSLDDFGIN